MAQHCLRTLANVTSMQDADLILLALLTHEPHFSLLREAGSLEEAVKELGLDPVEWSAVSGFCAMFLNCFLPALLGNASSCCQCSAQIHLHN